MEDQLSLAIGRDGQNARLAAKLTGWRIDIKSLIEAASDAIVKVQSDPSLANIAEVEHKNIPIVEEVLAKKTEGRPVTPDCKRPTHASACRNWFHPDCCALRSSPARFL